ncbi:hypothetical protein KHQ81_11025 [Mycoplasmatota bacterium]|nr:hypothetical protein KHQ81_11025 [Mycoplasmatota bacterium]
MIDVRTHQIIDMIKLREYEDVVDWLKSYPNLKVVSSDGSITYQKRLLMYI